MTLSDSGDDGVIIEGETETLSLEFSEEIVGSVEASLSVLAVP